MTEIPAGLAFSAHFEDESSDRVGGYLIKDRGTPYFSDDGTFFADLEASGMIVDEGARAQFIERVLKPANAYLDPDTLEIKSAPLDQDPDPLHYVNFLSALVRVRDVAFWTQERVKSTFNEDVISTMRNRYADLAAVFVNEPVDDRLREFPADVVLRPREDGHVTAVFLAQSVEKLTEAMGLAQEIRIRRIPNVPVAVLIESGTSLVMTGQKVQRAINRIQGFAFYRDDEETALDRMLEVGAISRWEDRLPR